MKRSTIRKLRKVIPPLSVDGWMIFLAIVILLLVTGGIFGICILDGATL